MRKPDKYIVFALIIFLIGLFGVVRSASGKGVPAPPTMDKPDIAVHPYVMDLMTDLLLEDNSSIAYYLHHELSSLEFFCDRSDWKRVPWDLHQAVMAYFSDPFVDPSKEFETNRKDAMRYWKESWTCLWGPGT